MKNAEPCRVAHWRDVLLRVVKLKKDRAGRPLGVLIERTGRWQTHELQKFMHAEVTARPELLPPGNRLRTQVEPGRGLWTWTEKA